MTATADDDEDTSSTPPWGDDSPEDDTPEPLCSASTLRRLVDAITAHLEEAGSPADPDLEGALDAARAELTWASA